MKHKDNLIPLNLQFFADDDTSQNDSNQPAPDNQSSQEPPKDDAPEITVESLMTELAKMKADYAKLKKTNDNLCTEAGTLRKQLREKMTAEEQEAEAKAEEAEKQAAYVKALERKVSITEATERYASSMNMPIDLAKATAEAEVDGDRDTVISNIAKFQKEREEQIDKDIRAEYAAQMPIPQSGNGGQVDYTEQFNKAMEVGNTQGAIEAILNQSQIQSAT